jgi:hypothetical protein
MYNQFVAYKNVYRAIGLSIFENVLISFCVLKKGNISERPFIYLKARSTR